MAYTISEITCLPKKSVKRRIFPYVLCLFVFLAWTCLAPAQGSEQVPPAPRKPPEPQVPRIIINVEKVIVPVTVKDAKGHMINDLKKSDFEIYEDGVQQDITDFSTDPRALSAIILVDTAMSERAEKQIAETLRVLIESFSSFDQLAIFTFEDRVQPLVPFGSDHDVAYTKLKKVVDVSGSSTSIPGGPVFSGSVPSINEQPIKVGPPPNYSVLKPAKKRIIDAIFYAALALKNQPKDRRKVILVISDGNNTEKNENSYAATLHVLLDNDIAVYGIANDQLPFVQHAEIFNTMPRFAENTGGEMFYSFKRETLENVYPDLTEEVRNQYELTYSPKRHTDDSVYKSIEVKVDHPGLTVTARQGYYAVSTPSTTVPVK